MWPDGNADVGRFESRLGTSGRGRLTTAAIVRKAASSPNMNTARKTTGRQARGEEDPRPPAAGDGEEHDAADDAHDEDVLGGPEAAADQAPVVQRRRAVRGEPGRDRVVAAQVAIAVAGDHDQFADAGEGTDDQHPAHDDSGRDAAVLSSPVML